jgi:hypothetical protein
MRCWHQNPRDPRLVVTCAHPATGHRAIRTTSQARATETYLEPAFGRHYAFYAQDELNGVQRAQTTAGSTPAGSFYCKLPEGLKVVPIIGSDGKQMLADAQGYLYDSGYANGETIGHPAYRVG